MAEVTVMASVRMEALGPGPSGYTVSPIALKKYLDANDIRGPSGNLSVAASGGSIPKGSGPSDAAATLINAINAIPPNRTIKTTISMTITYAPPGTEGSMYGGKFFIIIDWESGTVAWNGNQTLEQGLYNGSAEVPGDQRIKRNSYTAVNSATGAMWNTGIKGHPISLMLKTTSERKISGLPIPGIGRRSNEAVFQKVAGQWDGFVNVDYIITTDTGATVIAAPTPPPAPAAPVARVKISELPAAPPLQDDDLFVLSQDNPSDGDYDTSYRVTLAKLKAAVGASFQSGRWVAGDTLSISTTSVTTCGISIATGLNVADPTHDETGNIMGQFDVSSKILYLAQVYTGGSGSNAIPTENTLTLTDVFQDMLIKPTYLGVTVKARFDANTLYIELTEANMRGTYLITLS